METKINCENLRSGRGHFASDSRPNLQYSKKGVCMWVGGRGVGGWRRGLPPFNIK